jgi:hypothetical protein
MGLPLSSRKGDLDIPRECLGNQGQLFLGYRFPNKFGFCSVMDINQSMLPDLGSNSICFLSNTTEYYQIHFEQKTVPALIGTHMHVLPLFSGTWSNLPLKYLVP